METAAGWVHLQHRRTKVAPAGFNCCLLPSAWVFSLYCTSKWRWGSPHYDRFRSWMGSPVAYCLLNPGGPGPRCAAHIYRGSSVCVGALSVFSEKQVGTRDTIELLHTFKKRTWKMGRLSGLLAHSSRILRCSSTSSGLSTSKSME